ncbi:MAG: hypothetical protein KAU14_04215, partial [Thermoplasmata archaeon]|nr:hypothetical protein [Thermoplasmata archaeon]
NKNHLRDEFTTSVYDALMYLIGFDEDKELMSYISQLDNTEDITAAYNTLKALEEYDNLKDSIEDIKNNVAPFYSAQEAMNASIELAYSDEFQELLEAFEEYLEDAGDYDPGNSPLQNLIYRSSEMDDDEMENLMDTQEFDDWMNALNESSLKEVLDAFNNTVENITDKLEELENSTQLEDLEEEMEDFGRFMEGVDEYYWEYFYPDDTYTHYFDVPDAEWLTTLEMDMWIYFEWDSDYGKLCINITDPEGTVYPYVFEVEEHGHYFSIYDEELDAVPGEWRIDVEANETAEGDYEIEIGSDEDEFGEYYLAETAEELFLVQNAGIAVQAPFVQEIGEQVEIKFAAYDDDGPLADEGLNALILYGDPLVRPQEEFDRSRGWYEYDGGGYEDIGGELYVNPYTTKLLLTMDIGDIEPDDTVTFTLTEPDGTTEHIYTYDHADSLEQDVYKEEIETSSVGEWDADIEVEGSDTGEGYVRLTVNYEPEPVIMPFWFASTQSFTRILSQETITTDANGIATLEIDVDEPGIYAYFVELPIASDEEYYAAAFGGFLGVEFTIDFGLEGLGTIMGIPVYRNTEGIGDTLELDITLSEAMDADMDVSVGPLDLSEAFENIELDYEEDDDELTFSNEQLQTAELEVNGPISFLGAVALSPDEDNVQKYSMAFGILLTSDVEVNITTDEILTPGGRHELDVETAEGTPESTYGAALLKSWLDTNSFDTAYLTSLIFAEMHGEMIEPEPWDAADDMQTIIYGEGNTAFADIPALLWDDDFMLLTITEVEIETESKLGVSFTEGKRVPPLALEVITTNPKVNQDIQVKVTSDGGPVEGATVTVTKGGVFVTTAATGSDGLAGFQVNEAGTYHLQAAKDSFIPDETDITVKEVLEIEVITSTPTANQSIEVKVTSDGEPVEGVTVRVSKGGVVITTAATNSSGVAEFQVNEAGTYHLKAAKDPYIPDELDITVRAEGSSERTFYLTFSKDELKEGEEFTVTIKDTENDEPI